MTHFLDTNVVIWLYQAELTKFSDRTLTILEDSDLFISPLVKLELQYLYEIGRTKKTADYVCKTLYKDIGLQIHNLPLTVLIEKSLTENWTRDPFDRLIVSHAHIENASLITKDEKILKHYSKAIW
jgi:PIN domain nuclease of toxin-antitoxin system